MFSRKFFRLLKSLLTLPSYSKYVSWSWLPVARSSAVKKSLDGSVLILSLPRSGSSWVGETVGMSDGACYLREPITQTLLKQRAKYASQMSYISTVFEIPKESEGELFDNIIKGLPRFRPGIVTVPKQWDLRLRHQKKLVIKEVNPLAFRHILVDLHPKVVFLVRHPAAVASSFIKLGWFDERDWFAFGKRQAEVIKATINMLEEYGDYLLVEYESIANDPINRFQDIYQFIGLSFDSSISDHIKNSTTASSSKDPYNTSRDSSTMTDKWKSSLKASDVAVLMEGFHSVCPEYY